MCFYLFSSCRLLCPARLPLSQLSGGVVASLEKVEGEINAVQQQLTETEEQIAALGTVIDAKELSQKEERLHETMRQLRAKELLLREEKLLYLKVKLAHPGTLEGTLRVFVFPLCRPKCRIPFSMHSLTFISIISSLSSLILH